MTNNKREICSESDLFYLLAGEKNRSAVNQISSIFWQERRTVTDQRTTDSCALHSTIVGLYREHKT